ncbi:MAG: hypothetical protein ABIZ05_16770 [Pseudonocardiaceae bacterium]
MRITGKLERDIGVIQGSDDLDRAPSVVMWARTLATVRTHDLADLLLADLRSELPWLSRQPTSQRGAESASFSHGASPRHPA